MFKILNNKTSALSGSLVRTFGSVQHHFTDAVYGIVSHLIIAILYARQEDRQKRLDPVSGKLFQAPEALGQYTNREGALRVRCFVLVFGFLLI